MRAPIQTRTRSASIILTGYFDYYHGALTHLSLAKDAPETRSVELPENGEIRAVPQVGGLHHRYT